MKGVLCFVVAFITSSLALANDYSEALDYANQKAGEGKSLFQQFNKGDLPDFTENPIETRLKPSQKGELELEGNQFVEINLEARKIYIEAYERKEKSLDEPSKRQAKNDYENAKTNQEATPCSDGGCIPVKNEESDDFSEGAVEMGALGSVAQEVKDGQLKSSMPGIFKAKNITCRAVFRSNRVNFCRYDQHILNASQSEKSLHKAQREGRAIVVSGGALFCSKKIKTIFGTICIQKKQSWCVFQSKLARIVQVEARRQLNMNFGGVWGDVNAANCRGLKPTEISKIDFDSPKMRSALNEIVEDYRAKVKPLQQGKAQSQVSYYIESNQGGHDD